MENVPLTIRQLSINWEKVPKDSYLHTIPAIRNIQTLRFHAPVTIFTGENGSGKSTLLEGISIADGFNPEGGSRNYHFSTYDSHSELGSAISLVRSSLHSRWGYFFRAESFYNVASMEEEYSRTARIQAHYHQRSHGESFLKMAQLSMKGERFLSCCFLSVSCSKRQNVLERRDVLTACVLSCGRHSCSEFGDRLQPFFGGIRHD